MSSFLLFVNQCLPFYPFLRYILCDMSKHSKWAKIKRAKGANDVKRGALFTKFCNAVTLAAKAGGDPDYNFSLRLAIEAAKAGLVPKDNIEKAIKRGTGELKDGAVIEEVVYEGFGPAGVGMLIQSATDNRNRTVAELKDIMNKNGGVLGSSGSVQWQFEHKGVISIPVSTVAPGAMDNLELSLIDAGADNFETEEDELVITCPVKNFQTVVEALAAQKIKPESAKLEWVPKEKMTLSDENQAKLEALMEAVYDYDDVQEVYVNSR
jgi:YebC/PmpR family DNA-binding regulatory protein